MFKGRSFAVSLAASILAAFGSNAADAAVTQVEGSAGGGLVPWALLHPAGPLVSFTNDNTTDYQIQSVAVGTSFGGIVELSLAKQMVNAPTVANALNAVLPATLSNRIDMSTLGIKVRLVEMGKDNAMPQIVLGAQVKHTDGDIVDTLKTVGAISDKSGTDAYLAATKVLTLGGRKVVLDLTLRGTKANQFGLLGFGGGTTNNKMKVKAEAAAGVFVADNVVLGGEYRAKPNNIDASVFGIQEDAAWDVFVAYFVNKNMAITAAYTDLGQIGPSHAAVTTMAEKQDGLYLQVQANF